MPSPNRLHIPARDLARRLLLATTIASPFAVPAALSAQAAPLLLQDPSALLLHQWIGRVLALH